LNSNIDINELIVRKFSGEATPEENKIIENWINVSQENKEFFNDLNDIWLSAGQNTSKDSEFDVENAIQNFINRTRLVKMKRNQRHQIFNILRYAAMFILALAIPFTYWIAQKPNPVSDSTTTIFCAFGDKTSILLPDSSQVWLNSGSKITFNNNFKNGSRQLYLEGEGYFSVKKDADNPFLVNTANLNIKVLGTEFNLKAYPDEEDVSVTLVSGSLQVKNEESAEMINPGQKLLYKKDDHILTVENLTDLAPETEWIDGRLVFRNTSLNELEKKLERWFDVEIEFADETVKGRRFSGTLERESILEVISYFGISQYVDYSIKGNVITFFSENHQNN
jgi:transmembrane sensor